MTIDTQPFRVLSLDGGGMRGTYTATYLDRVAAMFARRRNVPMLDIGAAFDLIVGTSTGSIIACALVAGVLLGEIVSLYTQHGPKIFSRPLPSGIPSVVVEVMKRLVVLSSSTQALRTALPEKLHTKTLGEIYAERGIGLAIPAVEMGQHRTWVFKTPHLKDMTNNQDDHYTLVDVCLATFDWCPFISTLANDPATLFRKDVLRDHNCIWS